MGYDHFLLSKVTNTGNSSNGIRRHIDFRLISVSILPRETEIQEEKHLTHRP